MSAKGRDLWRGTYTLSPNGYVMRRKLLFRHPVPLQTFMNDPIDPLTFVTAEGDEIQPFRTFDGYDRGSVPLLAQGLVSNSFGEWTTINHDSAYLFKAWWRNGVVEAVTWARANHMIYRMARKEFRKEEPTHTTRAGRVENWLDDKGNRIANGMAWAGVMLGGWFCWRRTDVLTAENRRREASVAAVLEADDEGGGAR